MNASYGLKKTRSIPKTRSMSRRPMINNPNAPVSVKSKNNKLTSAKLLQRKRSGASKRKETRQAEEVWTPPTHRSRRAIFDLAQETRDAAEDASETPSSITHESANNSVTFAMFLGDVFGMSDKKNTTESAKSAETENADTVNCVDLMTSAKEIGTVTKDVLVEETMGCAAWSFAGVLAGIGHATGVNQPVKAETNDQPVADPVKVEGLSLLAEQILAEHMVNAKGPPTEAGDSISMLTDDDLPTQSAGPKSYDPSSAIKGMSTKSMTENVNADQRHSATPSNGMSTMSITEKSNADMKEHLRQIRELNAEMELLLARGDLADADVDLVNDLKHRSKVLCKGMATKTGRAAKVVGKSSKKGLGTALLSTSKAVGSLGEKLAKSKQDDVTHTTVTHTTGENSTLSSRSRSQSRSRPTSSCSRGHSQSRSRSVQSNTSASKGLKKTRRPMITPTTGDHRALSSRSRSRSR